MMKVNLVVIVRERVVFRKTVVGDSRFDYLSSSHLQSQVKSRDQMMMYLCREALVVVCIGQFCRGVIGRQNVKVAVIGCLLFYCYFSSVYKPVSKSCAVAKSEQFWHGKLLHW